MNYIRWKRAGMKLTFKENSRSLTLGAELEFQVMNKSTLQLTPRAQEIISVSNDSKIIREFFQSTVECCLFTGITVNYHAFRKRLLNELSNSI